MKTRIVIYLLPFALFFGFSCDDENEEPGDSSNVVYIEDDITSVTTWSGDSVYVIKAWDFYVSNTLTIEPGTIIKFHPDGPDMALGAGGTIIANGTANNPVVFTSWKDDAHGGDTNGDETQTTPAMKDWGGITTNDNNGSIFSHCEFYYGGSTSYSYTLQVYGNNIQVKNCIFAHNAGDDASGWYGALEANYAESSCVITGNIFFDNVRPLSVGVAFSMDNSNQFFNPADPQQGNTCNGIFVETGEDVNTAISWLETEVPFVIDDNDWWINSGASLTLGNNVCLKFRPGSAIVMDDTDAFINHDAPGVYFTSYKDDTRKGDTNGDGSATAPGAGDWEGIYDNIGMGYVNWINILYATN